MKPRCWFAKLPGAGPCDGRLRACHLIPKQLLRQHFPVGAVYHDGRWIKPIEARFLPDEGARGERTLEQLQADPRSWVHGCGGPTGIGGHHGRFDTAPHDRTRLVVPRALIPADTVQYAVELGLDWWLDKHYP